MEYGAITPDIDVAQVALYAFFFFFVGLVIYLRRENRREGFPMLDDYGKPFRSSDLVSLTPTPKIFLKAHGGTEQAPRAHEPPEVVHARPVAAWPGAPLQPTGNPMRDGVGPASWVARADTPELMFETGEPMIVPMRTANGFFIDPEDPDPRGMAVVGADNVVVGTVRDVWIDRSETVLRFLEMELDEPRRTVLVPMTLVLLDEDKRRVKVSSLMARHFADAPMVANPTQVTLREEDKIYAYFAGGHMYATPARLGPLL